MSVDVAKLALLQYLLADPVVATTATKVCPQKVPENTGYPARPYAVVTDAGRSRTKVNTGYSGQSKALLEVVCWGASDAQASDLADKVIHATGGTQGVPAVGNDGILDGFRGAMAGLAVQGVFLQDPGAEDSYQRPVFAEDVGAYSVTLRFEMWFREAS